MAQFARPDSVIAAGNFGFVAVGLWQDIDEVVADDGDYDQSAAWSFGSSDTLEVGLSNVTDPVSSAGHTIRARYNVPVFDVLEASQWTLTFELMQGAVSKAAVQASDSVVTAGWLDLSYTLSGAEADSISDYNDLRLKFTFQDSGLGQNVEGRISWAEFEVPNAPGGGASLMGAACL